jgi:hypothetical protein
MVLFINLWIALKQLYLSGTDELHLINTVMTCHWKSHIVHMFMSCHYMFMIIDI